MSLKDYGNSILLAPVGMVLMLKIVNTRFYIIYKVGIEWIKGGLKSLVFLLINSEEGGICLCLNTSGVMITPFMPV